MWGWVAARRGGFGPCWSERICDLNATCDRGPKKSCEIARARVTSLQDIVTKIQAKSSENRPKSTNKLLKIIKNQGSEGSGGSWGEVWEPWWPPGGPRSPKMFENHIRGPPWASFLGGHFRPFFYFSLKKSVLGRLFRRLLFGVVFLWFFGRPGIPRIQENQAKPL